MGCGSPGPVVGPGDDTESKTIGWKGPETLSADLIGEKAWYQLL